MVVLHFLSLKISFSRVWRANCPHVEGRIAHNGWANCNSPLHVRYPNVGKYYMQIASRAWHRFFCMRRRGELKFAHIANSPTPQFAHIAKFTHVEGRIANRPNTGGWVSYKQLKQPTKDVLCRYRWAANQ